MSLIRRSALAAVWVAALAGGGCFAAPPRSAGLAVPTATGPIRPPQKAQLAPIEALLSPDGQPVVNPASLRDPVPKVARPADAPPEAGMPEVKQLPNGGEAPRSGDEPASLESQAGELPVYAVEAPAEPPASAFSLTKAVTSNLPVGDAGLSGVVRNMFGSTRPVVAGAWVVVVSAADATKRAERQTDAQGRYRLSGIAPGGYFVLASLGAGGVRLQPQYIVLPEGETGGVNFAVYQP